MSFSSLNGYTAVTIADILDAIRTEINTQFGTSYTAQSFVGTNYYKYFYALAQRVQANEVKTSEIFLYVQQYFKVTNERIQRPVATAPGIIEALEGIGYIASVKKMIEADAGKISIAVQVDGYEFASVTIGDLTFTAVNPGTEGNDISIILANTATAGSETIDVTDGVITIGIQSGTSTATQIKTAFDADADAIALAYVAIASGQEAVAQSAASETPLADGTGDGYLTEKTTIGTMIKDSIAGGILTQGDQVENIVLTNGQDFDFKYFLPTIYDVLLRLTVHTSDNNQVVILTPEEVKQILIDNIEEKYRLGRDFEPQKYFTTEDAPWSANVLLEWSINGGADYYSTVYEAAFDDLFNVKLENITLVES